MSCDEEQVCLMIKQVQVKAISDGGYGPFSNTYNVFLAIATNIPQRLKTGFVVQGHI